MIVRCTRSRDISRYFHYQLSGTTTTYNIICVAQRPVAYYFCHINKIVHSSSSFEYVYNVTFLLSYRVIKKIEKKNNNIFICFYFVNSPKQVDMLYQSISWPWDEIICFVFYNWLFLCTYSLKFQQNSLLFFILKFFFFLLNSFLF